MSVSILFGTKNFLLVVGKPANIAALFETDQRKLIHSGLRYLQKTYFR